MKAHYSAMHSKKSCSNVEGIITQLDGYVVVFTMAILMHVHPESESVFAEIARVAKNI